MATLIGYHRQWLYMFRSWLYLNQNWLSHAFPYWSLDRTWFDMIRTCLNIGTPPTWRYKPFCADLNHFAEIWVLKLVLVDDCRLLNYICILIRYKWCKWYQIVVQIFKKWIYIYIHIYIYVNCICRLIAYTTQYIRDHHVHSEL